MNGPTCMKFGGCPAGVWRVFGGCLRGVSRVHGWGLEHIYGMSKWCVGVGSLDYLKVMSGQLKLGQLKSRQDSSS